MRLLCCVKRLISRPIPRQIVKPLDFVDKSRTSASVPLRPLVIICAVALLALSAGVFIGGRALITRFEQAEAAAMAEKALQVYRAFDADFRQLAISNRDYAQWDDAVQYVHSRNPAFITANFVRNALAGMHVDLVLIIDGDGHEIYSGYSERSGAQVLSPVPQTYLELRQLAASARRLSRLPPAERIVATPRGLAAVSAVEITRSDGTEPTGATMLFARFIEDADIERVRETSHLSVALLPLGSIAQHRHHCAPGCA